MDHAGIQTDAVGDVECRLIGGGDAVLGLLEAQLVDQRLETLAVFSTVNSFW